MKTFQEYLEQAQDEYTEDGSGGEGAPQPGATNFQGTQSSDVKGVNMPLFGKKKKSKLVSRKAVKYQVGKKLGGWGKYINVPE